MKNPAQKQKLEQCLDHLCRRPILCSSGSLLDWLWKQTWGGRGAPWLFHPLPYLRRAAWLHCCISSNLSAAEGALFPSNSWASKADWEVLSPRPSLPLASTAAPP